MREVLPAVQFCCNKIVLLGKCNPELKLRSFKSNRQCNLSRRGGEATIKSGFLMKAQMISPSTYSSKISTDIPLYEVPGASFDDYLEDMPRVFEAMFPDKRRSQRLNEVLWRLTENMKERVNKSLQTDYNAFKREREKLINLV